MSQHDDKEGSVVVLREDIIHTAYQCRARGMTELAAQLEAMLVNAPVAPSAELRNEIIEECARECDSIRDTKVASVKERGAAIACAALIRALKNAAPQEARLPESEGGARPAQEAATRPGGTQTAPAGAAPGIPSHVARSGTTMPSESTVAMQEAICDHMLGLDWREQDARAQSGSRSDAADAYAALVAMAEGKGEYSRVAVSATGAPKS